MLWAQNAFLHEMEVKKGGCNSFELWSGYRLTAGSDRPTHLTVNLQRTRSGACESIRVSSSQEKPPLLRVFGVDAGFLHQGKFSGHDMGVRWADWTDWWFGGPAHPTSPSVLTPLDAISLQQLFPLLCLSLLYGLNPTSFNPVTPINSLGWVAAV